MKKFNVEKDIYAIITDKIIAKIEEGFIPWKKPWMSKGAACNFVTKKPYRGINSLLLNSDEKTPYYLTFNQATLLGGKIKKGAKAEMIVYWNFVYILKESGKQVKPEDNKYPADQICKKAFLKYYNVFNIEDTENIPYTSPVSL